MSFFERALVVDGSGVARQLLALHLRGICGSVDAVASVSEARERVDAAGDVSLVVVDARADGALAWLEECAARPLRPAFAVVTTRPSVDEETRVTLLGALAYLSKPLAPGGLAQGLVEARS